MLESRAVHAPHRIELLRGLGQKEIELILAAAKRRRFSAKSVMTYQDEPADHLLLLWKGRARYFFETPNGKKLILRWITPGDIFGGAALVSRPSTYLVSTEVVRDSVVLLWDGPTIRALARRFPELLENAIFLAADYISWYVAAHAALTSKTAQERLAHVLLELAPSIGQKVAGGIELNVTNEELANSANITPYTTSRMVSEWQRSGAIRKHRGKILLRSPERFFLRVVSGACPA
jgi:CRP-like cAMP-binding protein